MFRREWDSTRRHSRRRAGRARPCQPTPRSRQSSRLEVGAASGRHLQAVFVPNGLNQQAVPTLAVQRPPAGPESPPRKKSWLGVQEQSALDLLGFRRMTAVAFALQDRLNLLSEEPSKSVPAGSADPGWSYQCCERAQEPSPTRALPTRQGGESFVRCPKFLSTPVQTPVSPSSSTTSGSLFDPLFSSWSRKKGSSEESMSA